MIFFPGRAPVEFGKKPAEVYKRPVEHEECKGLTTHEQVFMSLLYDKFSLPSCGKFFPLTSLLVQLCRASFLNTTGQGNLSWKILNIGKLKCCFSCIKLKLSSEISRSAV